MKTQLVIMAAGIGSRFGQGIKQLEKIGPNGEIIIDYSIKYAIQAGFDEVLFIIRKEIENDFKEIIGNRIEKEISCKYAFQELDKLPKGFNNPSERKKPYGTGHALLCCKDLIDSPFIIINADDYYGKEGFVKIHDYLLNIKHELNIEKMCMAGFNISNTLSDNGAVTRGICVGDSNNRLLSVNETYDISRNSNNQIIGFDDNKNEVLIKDNSIVSMNMWGLEKEFVDCLEERFIKFLEKNISNIKSEFLLPSIIDDIIKEEKGYVDILPVSEKWYGITYKEDTELVREALKNIKI